MFLGSRFGVAISAIIAAAVLLLGPIVNDAVGVDETARPAQTEPETLVGIHGRVLDPVGEPVLDATVDDRLTGQSTRSDEKGVFFIETNELGTHVLSVSKPGFRESSKDIHMTTAHAASVVFVLSPQDTVSGPRSHRHDYWSGLDRVDVIRRTFDWHATDGRTGPSIAGNQAVGKYYRLASQVASSSCVYRGEAWFSNRDLWFDDPAQLVWPGTSEIQITATWAGEDAPGVDALHLAWRAKPSTPFETTGPLRNGVPFSLPVEPSLADKPHQPFTSWEMFLCIAPDEFGEYGSVFVGSVSVRMSLLRGFSVPFDPPHPDPWNGQASHLIANGTTVLGVATNDRMYGQVHRFRLLDGRTIPGDTSHVDVHLEWESILGGPELKLGASYRSADQNPATPYDGKTKVPTPTAKTFTSRQYRIQVEDRQSDGPYENQTRWAFYVSEEGQEQSEIWVSPCGCEIPVTYTVTAFRSQARS